MDVLAESALYHRAPQQNIRDCPELGVKLQIFMVNFFSSLPEENRGSVLLQLIQRLGSRQWCAVPLLFLSQALSCLSPCPLLGSDGLHAFSYVQQRLKTFLAVPANSDQKGSLPDPAEAELLARAVLLTADLQKTRNEEPGLELLLQPLLDVLQRLSTNVYLVLHKTDKSLQLLLSLLRLHRRRSDTEQENEDVVAVALKTHMLSVGDSVQEFLLRRLSGELRENPSVPGQVQRAVGMATLALLCDVADRGVLKSQSEAMRSLYSLTDYFYPSSSSSSQHLNQTLLKPTTATVSHPEDGLLLKDWGRIVAQFIGDQWTRLSFLQKLVQEVQSYVEQFGDTCAANTAVSSDNRDDQFPRVCALAFLCRLNPSNRLHQRLMEELVQRLLRKDAEISKSKVRYYSNSIQHRVKNRVWQTLLLLLHKLRLAGFCSNQASVKYLIEWTLILILHLNPSRIQNLWNCFSLEHEKTRTSICTFFSVLVHLNVLFPKLQDKTIFQTFPSLSELSEDEWLPLWKFESFVVFPMCAALPLKNRVRDLCEFQPGDWIQQDKGVLEQDERWAEVQKKITPWKLSVQEQEPELMAQQRAARLGKLTSNLLVVASLIDKPTNLGGLCRTCEIFGAKALVLDSLRHINDKQFQALSVSSELWLPMLEVKPAELSDYLQLKKREGYWVIGVEQTSNSQSLQDYTFPERSLLLLGNEREGIPANLLQLVDVCVEIPQNGVTRSLNVHVSAALLVWEYTRQHLGQNPAAPRC
ncbi:unnamed protein product [Leuciscus chuanchicus]